MIEASQRQELFDTLKAFNNSAVSIRLYPEKAPQVTNAVERGYKLLKQHLRHRGVFTLGLQGTDAVLCGEIVPEDILKSFSNLILYRQLDLLQLSQLSISPGLDRANFRKILDIFSAKVDRIKEEGGGWAYASRLGLDRFFLEESQTAPAVQDVPLQQAEKLPDAPKVPREYISVLLGIGKDSDLTSQVGKLMLSAEKGSVLLSATVIAVLQNILKKHIFGAVPALQDVFTASESMVPDEKEEEFARETASLLLKHLSLPEATLFLAQQFPEKFGTRVKNAVIQHISLEKYGNVITGLRQKISQLRLTQTSESPQLVFVSGALARLLATPKGKQFLGQEKAKSILEAGEKNRRAKRVQAGIKSLMQGNFEVLQSDEFCLHLPLVMKKLKEDGRDKEVTAVLQVLSLNMEGKQGEERARLTGSLAGIGENLVREKSWDQVRIITDPLLYWLNHSRDGDTTFEKVCFILQSLMNYSFTTGEFELADTILSAMYKIHSGAVRKPEAVRNMVSRAQERGVDRGFLAQLLEASLAEPADEILSRRIILQGPAVSRFLVDSLIKAEDKQDRIKLIDLLTYGEKTLSPILVEKLSEPMPWYGKRNLLKLLADCGGEEHIDVVYPFLGNDDLRVQREAFVSLYKISGRKRKSMLLQALNDTSETIKLQVIRALANFGNTQVVQGLAQLLDDHPYYSEDFRDDLLEEVCQALGSCQSPESEKTLLKFLDQRNSKQGRKIGERVWQAAEEARVEAAGRQQGEKSLQAMMGKQRKSVLTQVSSINIADTGRKSITGFAEERKIQELFEQQEDNSRARIMLLDLIAKVARLGRFNQAQHLREWLIEVDSTALTEIIRAAEIIEEEKKAAVDDTHAELWTGLFDVLASEEFNSLYHALILKEYSSEELIVKKGMTKKSLFFINSGKVKLFYRQNGSDVLVKTLKSGEMFGTDTFFDESVWTLSAAAMGKVGIAELKLDRLEKLKKQFPALESKLQSFCRPFDNVEDFFKNPGKDRRQFQRFEIKGVVAATLLDSKGQSTGVHSKGELFDICTGGASFYKRISRKENTRLLLGRSIRFSLQTEDSSGRQIIFDGDVMAVRPQHTVEFEYSVHVEFKKPLDPAYLQRILEML